jgi:hypothetical protein
MITPDPPELTDDFGYSCRVCGFAFPQSALRMFDVFDGSNRPFFLKELMLKKAFSALLHSLPPLLPVTLPNIHRTTSHGSAANEGSEKPAVRHRSAAAIAVFHNVLFLEVILRQTKDG